MSENGLIKVMNWEELSRLEPKDRVIINGERAGVLFSGGETHLFLRSEEGQVYEMAFKSFEVEYNSDGTVSINNNWRKTIILDEYHRATLIRLGVID